MSVHCMLVKINCLNALCIIDKIEHNKRLNIKRPVCVFLPKVNIFWHLELGYKLSEILSIFVDYPSFNTCVNKCFPNIKFRLGIRLQNEDTLTGQSKGYGTQVTTRPVCLLLH